MKQHQSGIVLLMTLLLLGVISTLVVTQLETILLYQKAMAQFFKQQQIRHNLETVAQQIQLSSQKKLYSNCIITAYENPNRVITALTSKQACVLSKDKMDYYFLFEDLGTEPCLQALVQEVLYSTRHWRLTIAFIGETSSDYLQIRVAKLTDLHLCPKKSVRQIMPGVVSWRFWSGS